MDSILEKQAETYLHPGAKPGLGLHFPEELEARFELERLESRSRQVTITGLVALAFYDLFLFADYAKHPSVMWRCVVLRLGIATPMVLLTCFAAHRRVRAAVREVLILLSVTLAGGGVLAVSYNLNRIDSLFSQTGFLLIVFFGVLVLRQKFLYSVATLAVMLLEDTLFVTMDHWMTLDDKITALFMVVASILLTLIASFIMEQQERTSFALFLKEGFHNETLSRLNQKLTALSQVDGLTGLSNRRHFEQRFQELWREAIKASKPLSLLMIDIDHFKRLNDTYGHIAGDRVLIQMGQILMSAVRAGDDLVARFGGEEFIVLLMGANHETAHEIAENLRALVYHSPMALADTHPHSSVSVSCGLATGFPLEGLSDDEDRLKLVGAADLALYAAKSAGRNRVCCRACEAMRPERRWRPGGRIDGAAIAVSSADFHVG